MNTEELEFLVDDGVITPEEAEHLASVETDLVNEDIEPFVRMMINSKKDLKELKSVFYEEDERFAKSQGFDGAFVVTMNYGTKFRGLWKAGSSSFGRILPIVEKQKVIPSEGIASKIKNMLLRAQPDGPDALISYENRHKMLDVEVNGDSIDIIYVAQEGRPEDVKEEIQSILSSRGYTRAGFPIYLDASNRNGEGKTFKISEDGFDESVSKKKPLKEGVWDEWYRTNKNNELIERAAREFASGIDFANIGAEDAAIDAFIEGVKFAFYEFM